MRTFDGRFAVVWRTLGAVHVHTHTYIDERAGRFLQEKEEGALSGTETTPSQTIRKRRLILSTFGNEIFRAFP